MNATPHITPVEGISVILIILVLLMVLGGVVAMIAMLANRKTRVAGIVLLVFGVMALLFVGAGLFAYRSARVDRAMSFGQSVELERTAQQARQRSLEESIAVRERLRPTIMPPAPSAVPAPVILDKRLVAEGRMGLVAADSASNEDDGETAVAEVVSDGEMAPTAGEVPEAAAEPAPTEPPAAADPAAAEPAASTEPAAAEPASTEPEAATKPATAELAPAAAIPGESTPTAPAPVVPAASVEKAASTPGERPSWVDAPAQRVDDSYQMSITIGPYTSRLECEARLPGALQEAAHEYGSLLWGPQNAYPLALSTDFLRERLVQQQWEETIHASFGPMVQLHVLLRFDQAIKTYLEQQRTQSIVTTRIWCAGAALTAILLVLAVLFAFLKTDQATGGKCRGRLTLAAVLMVFAMSAMMLLGLRLLDVRTMGPRTMEVPSKAAPATATVVPVDPVGLTLAESEDSPRALSPAERFQYSATKSWVALAAVIGLVAAVLGGFAALVALLAHPRTREVGLMALVLGGVVLLGLSMPEVGPNLKHLLLLAAMGVPLLIVAAVDHKRRVWTLGFLGCAIAASWISPYHPAGMLIAIVPLVAVYALGVLIWRKQRAVAEPANPDPKHVTG